MSAVDAFSASYAEARDKFLEAARAAGASVEHRLHPLPGRDGEALAVDAALDGEPDARALLVVSSACHGVEGFCGSAVQVTTLRDGALRGAAAAGGVALLHLHALNPWGFSWTRRTTHENVDLNRNFHDFSQPLPANPGYDAIADLLVPARWPPPWSIEARLLWRAWRGGRRAIQAAVSSGQHRHADGLFYGGTAPCWSHLQLRELLRRHAARCARLAWIDVHSGLGPSGVGERILACREDAATLDRARRWWGPAITSTEDGTSSSAALTGCMWLAAEQECPQAEFTGIALEFGTQPTRKVFDALRADQWLQNHPQAAPDRRLAIKRQVRAAFYTETADWKAAVLRQAREAIVQAVAGLATG